MVLAPPLAPMLAQAAERQRRIRPGMAAWRRRGSEAGGWGPAPPAALKAKATPVYPCGMDADVRGGSCPGRG